MKRFASFLIIFLLMSVGSFAAGNDFSVDFSSSTGFGVSSHTFQINNINLDISVTNPLTGETMVQNTVVNVLWQWDQQGLCLRPTGVADNEPGEGCETTLRINVTSALTGEPIQGAMVTINNEVQNTDAEGVATFNDLPEGNVLVNVVAQGYLPQDTSVSLACGEETGTGVSLLPSGDSGVASGDIRIVLTWGENPADLDSHLTGPRVSGSARFHVYYSNDNNCYGRMCDEDVPAWLDVDDRDSYGPETITITKVNGQFVPGRYRYSVHHYSGDANIPTSGAVVKVFQGDQLLRTFYPPQIMSDNPGINWVWTVFELNILPDGTVSLAEVGTYNGPVYDNDINAFSSVKTYLGVPVYSEDMTLFKNLPEKK